MDVVNVFDKLAELDRAWVPKIVGELNGQHVKVAKLHGEYIWHSHAQEDELFYVLRGELELHLRERVVTLRPGEFLVVPRGVEHKPVSPGETFVLLFEPATTRNTGEVDHPYTIEPADVERL